MIAGISGEALCGDTDSGVTEGPRSHPTPSDTDSGVRKARRSHPTPSDTDSGVRKARRSHSHPSDTDSGVTDIDASPPTPPHPDADLAARGLPDFTTLIELEMERAAAEEAARARPDLRRRRAGTPSPLGVGELFLTARELAGLSQRNLADRARTSQSAINTVESGNRLPTIRTLMRVTAAAGFDLVVGLLPREADDPVALGFLLASDDGLADYVPVLAPTPFQGPPEVRAEPEPETA